MFHSVRVLLREPLLHFLIAGAGLFLLFDFVSEPEMTGDENIIVSSGQIEHLATLFAKTWQRPPSDVETRGLIDNFILEEVLYREATAIGLDQDDTIIRRRLRQKMEFLVDDFSAAEASDDELQQFLDANPDRFRADARISFEHVYFADSPSSVVAEVLTNLQGGEAADSISGFASGLLPRRFDDAAETTIAGQFGASFKDRLFGLETERWVGPIESPFGLHVIYIGGIVAGRVPLLAEIRNEVHRDWLADRREAAQTAFFDQLRARYDITIEETGVTDR